jgi:hypothetical protein
MNFDTEVFPSYKRQDWQSAENDLSAISDQLEQASKKKFLCQEYSKL